MQKVICRTDAVDGLGLTLIVTSAASISHITFRIPHITDNPSNTNPITNPNPTT